MELIFRMLSKDELKKQFARESSKYYKVPLFDREGFQRFECPKCGKGYWTTFDTGDCGDSSHTKYSFFKKNPGKTTYAEFWKKTSDFWKKNGHEVIDRYPTVCRWRDDLPFTIASIVDFQRLEQGKVVFEYPANPLFVPQMCLRFPDVANVGVTGRHFTCFMMAGQHAFNTNTEKGYWKDECLELNYKYNREVLNIPKDELIYGEDVWNMPDFSAFGPCIETFSKGSEIVNSVFMQYRATPTGGFEELDTRVIDVGWGFERLLWYSNGTLTAYDSVFPNEIEFMKQNASIDLDYDLQTRYSEISATLDVENVHTFREEKKKIAATLGLTPEELEKGIAPMQAIYAIADHTRTLLFALSDGALPSNSAGGYNLRVITRRALSFIDKYKFNFSLYDLCAMHADDLKPVFPELTENLANVEKILDAERRKYADALEKGRRVTSEAIKKNPVISTEQMATMYESSGITPELIEQVAREMNVEVSVPSDFYSTLTAKNVMAKAQNTDDDKKPKLELDVSSLAPTRRLYYEDQDLVTCTAKVVAKKDNVLIFDQTIMYPQGGGQEWDEGTLDVKGTTFKVYNVQKLGQVILHFVEKAQVAKLAEVNVGDKVIIHLDKERRDACMKHHSATHTMIATCRNYFGPHVWQCGAHKSKEDGHIDFTHFEKPTQAQLQELETRANAVIRAALNLKVEEISRKDAEAEHGMRLYQGGGAVGKIIRIVTIPGLDVEACGGTHVHNTSEMNFIKISSCEQIQDGVIRLTYKAAIPAIIYIQDQENLILKTADTLGSPKGDIAKSAAKFVGEWEVQRKQIDKLTEKLAELTAESLLSRSDDVIEYKDENLDAKLGEKIANTVGDKGKNIVLIGKDGFIVVRTNGTPNALELLKSKGAKGGGSDKYARGKINK